MTTTVDLKALRGPYNTRWVDWIEAHVVTDEMIECAVEQSEKSGNHDMVRRRKSARRAIAIGIRCGSYNP